MTEAQPAPDDDAARPPTAVPFVAAVVVVAVVGAFAFVFLRADDDGRLVRPARVVAVDDDTVVAFAPDQPACQRIERAQFDRDDARVYVELVAVDVDGCDDDGREDVEAEIDLGVDVGDRRLVAGVGRTQLPCTGTGSAVRCGPDR